MNIYFFVLSLKRPRQYSVNNIYLSEVNILSFLAKDVDLFICREF